MGLFGRKSKVDASRDPELDEGRAVDAYRTQVSAILTKHGPTSRHWKRLVQSVEQSSDEDYLALLRAGAEEIWDSRGNWSTDPDTIEYWVDDLVRRINLRLRTVSPRAPSPPLPPPPPKPAEIVGEQYHQDALERVLKKATTTQSVYQHGQLVPEPENTYDANAVAVIVGGERIGYMNREAAAQYSPVLQQRDEPLTCAVHIEAKGTGVGRILFVRFAKAPPSPADLSR